MLGDDWFIRILYIYIYIYVCIYIYISLDKILNIQPKTYEYKDVINRGTKRVYGFISQQTAEIIPEAVSTQKGHYMIHIVILNVMEILFIYILIITKGRII